MAIDNKYGRVTLEHGDIGDDEVVIVFRARDAMLPKLLGYYHMLCLKAGSPRHHLGLIIDTHEKVLDWQAKNLSKVRTPNSDNHIKRMEQ